jgi:hypothetical protein
LYLFQPHPAQVVSIFRLLGFDKEIRPVPRPRGFKAAYALVRAAGPTPPYEAELIDHIDNHFAEILTGEGKSLTLAITAAVLALLG